MKGMALLVFCWLSLDATAQQPPAAAVPPTSGAASVTPIMFVSAADISARAAKAEAAAKSGTPLNAGPLLATGAFKLNMEFRNVPAVVVNIHETEAELFLVFAGSGTLTLGGTLTNPTRDGTNLQAPVAQGGVPYKIAKGDIILIPENTAHSVTQSDGKLVLMSMHLPRPAPSPAAPPPR